MITYGSTTLTSYNSIVRTEVYYYKSTSATSLSGGSWSTTKPTWENGKYIWQKIRTVYEDGTHSESDPVNITGQQGATGTAAYSYKLNSSDSIIGKTKDGEYTIKKITFSATCKQGTGAVSAYNGRFKIESTTNGSTWKTEYTSSGNESSKEFTIPDDIILIKCSLYQSDGTTVLLDIVTVPVVKDGVDAIGLRDSIPYYLASDKDTGVTRLTQGWTRHRPQLTAEKKYLWVYYVSRYSEGTTEPELIEIKDDLVHFVNNGDESPVESCVVDIEPVQDLHGYDHPWPAGGGKNKFNPDFTDTTINGVSIAKSSDGKITTSSVPTSPFDFVLGHFSLTAGTYILNGAPANGGAGKWRLQVTDYPVVNSLGQDNGSGVTFTLASDMEIAVRLQMYTGSSASLTFAPMIRLSSETDATYAPYENICPISGFTGCEVQRTGKNLLNLVESEMVSSGLNRIFPISLKAGTYIISCQNQFGTSTKGAAVALVDDSGANVIKWLIGYEFGDSTFFGRAVTITEEEASKVKNIRFSLRASGATYNDIVQGNIQLELGSTATDYEPYQGETYPITFPSEAGTVYGGYVDVISRELVVNREMVIKSASDFNTTSTAGQFFIDVAPYNSGTFVSWNENLSNIAINANTSVLQPNQMYIQSGFRIQLKTAYTSKDEFVSAMGDTSFEFCGKLVTPIHYPLTPQEITMLCKENNIFADTGQTAISYYDNQTSTDPYVDYSATSAFEYANTAINRATAVYGTCSTDAGTAAKAVTCSNFVLFNGARIQVTFTNANTASALTLNVNSTGAKAIYINKTVTSSSNLLLWTAGSKMEFVYDGTGWIAQNVPYALYGTCSTGASTAAKAVTCNEAVICKGTTISVNMTNTNTAANATMNVGSTLAKDIYANDAKLTTNSRFNWRANTTQKFVFDGQVWRMDDDSVKALATAYITEIDDDGIMVHPEDDDTSGWAISDAIQLFKSGISYIKLWIENNIPKIRIGKEDQGHIILDNDSVDIRNDDTVLASFGATSVIGDTNDWHQTIAANQITFAKGDNTITYISPDKLYTINAEVADAFYISNYSIRNASDGKLVIGLRR